MPLCFLFRRSASASSLIHSEEPPEQSREICSACEGRKVTLGDDRGTKMEERGRRRERESEATNEEERLAGKEGTGGGIKLALGHLMTNNGTAPHHCREAAREQKRGGTMRNDCTGSYVSSTGLTESHNIVLWKYSHIWVLENHTAHESEGTTNIYSILCYAHPTPLIYGSTDTTLIWTNVLLTARQIERKNKQ